MLFCTFLLLQDFVVKRPNFTFYEVSEKCVKLSKRTRWLKISGAFSSLVFTLLEKESIHRKQQLVVDCLRHSRSCENRKSVFHEKHKNQERRPFIAAVKGDWSIVIKHLPPRDLKSWLATGPRVTIYYRLTVKRSFRNCVKVRSNSIVSTNLGEGWLACCWALHVLLLRASTRL